MDAVPQPGAPHTLAGSGQHRRRAIYPYEMDARPAERDGDATGAASELQHGTAGLGCEVPPERHVTPAERARVLPVVERRVLVPALVAFVTRFSVQRSRTAWCSGSRQTRSRPFGPPPHRR